VGDFNGDLKTDLAILNQCVSDTDCTSGAISVLLGNRDGTLQPRTDYGVGQVPKSEAVGDFNRDSTPDLVAVNSLDNTASILIGRGDGTFIAKVDYGTGVGPMGVAVADLDGDGKSDLVVVDQCIGPTDCTKGSASVLLGNGDGTFQPKVEYPTGSTSRFVAVGDLNGDRRPDLAVVNEGDNTVSVLIGNGDGTFRTQVAYSTGNLPLSLVIGDFNGDGNPDLAVANSTDNTVSVLNGRGDGTFGTRMDYAAGSQPISLAIADFNRDGKPDLVVSSENSNSVRVLLNSQGTVMRAQASSNSSVFGQDVTFTVTVVAGLKQPAVPAGAVTVKDGAVILGSGVLVNGSFSVIVAGLAPGDHSISISYSGDSNFQPNVTVLAHTVQPGIGLRVASGGSSSATVSAGSIASYALAIGGGGVGGAASLTCTGTPQGASCELPASVSVDGNVASTFTVSVTTTPHATASLRQTSSPGLWTAILFALALWVSAGRGASARRRLFPLPLLLLLICSCGPSNNRTIAGVGTPSGTYTLNVTATLGSTSRSKSLILIVH
jgi:hypothetical protein